MELDKDMIVAMEAAHIALGKLPTTGVEWNELVWKVFRAGQRYETTALKEENIKLKKQREIAENRLGDFLDEYNQSLYHRTKRLAQAILKAIHKYYQEGGCGKAYKETIKELNQYLAEENTRTVAELESIAMTILRLKDSLGPVPPSMYH